MATISFLTLLANGSQTITDDDGEEVIITAVFNGGFFDNGGSVQSDDAVDTDPDSFTLTFSRPVENFSFSIGDVNSNNFAGGFNDRIEVVSTFNGQPAVTTLSAGTSGTVAIYEAPLNTNITLDVSVAGPIDQITLTNFDPDQQQGWIFLTTGDVGDVVCFVKGVLIETASGPLPVDELTVGDLITTCDHGPQPLRWIGKREVTLNELMLNEKLRPVKISAGALAPDLPKRDLHVSRQHRILASSKVVKRMFGTDEVLVPANKLTPLPGIQIDRDVNSVTYYHLLFDAHEIIYSEGTPTESLYVGPESLKTLGPEALDEILTIFPELLDMNNPNKPARCIPRGSAQRKFVDRIAKNGKDLIFAQST